MTPTPPPGLFAPNNCAVREFTTDGEPCGRCWRWLRDDTCPRHGDVSKVQDNYRRTGELTDEASVARRTP